MTDRSAIVILGGGMAGVTAAFELSRHGWRDRFRSITLYQRGWLLGGKGASSRDADGRILEHGLHVWPGYYDNAFRVLRDCYDELDRPRTDPDCPIRTWGDAFVPAPAIGVFEHVGDDTIPWLARFRTNDRLPGDPDARDDDLGDLARRLLGLAQDMARSAPGRVGPRVETGIDLALTVGRGIAADELLRGPGGFGRVDHEDFRAWLRRHGARSDTVDGGIVRGMYDLVFGYRDGEKATPAFAAGLGVFLAVRMFLDYKGALFWKMTAGMGEIVFAPFHQVLAARGVTLRYFHRVDGLELDAEGRALEAIRLTRQATPDGTDSYEPLDRHDDLPCFPARPRVAHAAAVPTEDRPVDDPGTPVILRRGQDFDTAVLAVSIGALPRIAAPLVRRLPEWRDMIRHVGTVGTHAAQVWLAPTEEELGWPAPGATLAGLEAPFDTCASMSHLLAREGWDAHGDRSPRSLAYLCSALPDGATRTDPDSTVRRFVREWSPALWPDAVRDGDGPVVRSVYTRVDADASDRYVQALPGSDAYRLRVDGSGVAHLVLAGDWTDCGLNAGCIEAAAISGIEAAAAVEGRPLTDRVLGPLTWDWP